MKKYRYRLENLDCAKCASEIEEALSKDSRLEKVVVNFSTLQLSFESNEEIVLPIVKKIVLATEPDVKVLDMNEDVLENKNKFYGNLIRLGIGIFLTLIGYFLELPWHFNTFTYLIAYVILLYRTFIVAMKLLVKSKTINESFLISISTIGAFLIGEELEGLMVIILYEIGKILEDRAIHSTRKSIKGLMDIKAEYANKKDGEKIVKVLPEDLKVGEHILVKVGEKVPVYGKVILGESSLDTSSLTGETKPLSVTVGDSILSGSINISGLLEVEIEKEYAESTVSKILDLVENATDKKAKTETFVNKASKVYTPIVIGIGFLIAIILPIVTNTTISDGIYRALTFLVISCPCAIAISVPLSYFSGIGACSKAGILIKGSNYLDALKKVDTICFDKTGTLTTGKFVIDAVEVIDPNYTKQDILKLASLGEQYSNHPIAISILKEGFLDKNILVSNYQEISGKGITFDVGSNHFIIGNSELVNYYNEKKGTILYLKKNDSIIGAIFLTDEIKTSTKKGLDNLKNKKIRICMFTGDNEEVASMIASKLEIENYKAKMLPTDKYQELEKLLSKDKIVAFVGDGINDAPVLALSDVGISMGGVGSASAIEASDIVIMNDDINSINIGIEIAKYTEKIIRENLWFAFIVKILILLFSAFGIASMWQAVFADVGVTLITILNTIRILKRR